MYSMYVTYARTKMHLCMQGFKFFLGGGGE